MKINTKKALAVFDLETTGLDISTDRIVEIAVLKITPSGEEVHFNRRINPEIDISPESIEIHGITNKMVANEPTFKDIAEELALFIDDSDLIGFNSNKFDIPLLAEEFLRVGHNFDIARRKFIDVQNIFHKMEQRTLVAAYKFYCDKDLSDAHNALADVKATYEVLLAQLNRYKDNIENSVDFLAEFSENNKNKIIDFAGRIAKNKSGKAIYNFGKHKGKTIAEVADTEPGYYGWMMNSNFPLYTKEVLKKEMEKIKAKRQEKKKEIKANDEQLMKDKIEALKNKFGN